MRHIADRRSDSVDIENFAEFDAYLRRAGRVAAADRPSFSLLSGGVSNRVVLVEFANGSGWVVKQALEKLRVTADWYCSLERIHREALALALLEKLAPAGSITPLIFEDRERFLLAMEAVPTPHVNWKHALMGGNFNLRLFEEAGDLLRAIHQRGAALSGSTKQEFADRGFFQALRVEPYYLYTASVVPEASQFLLALAHEMEPITITIVHGDFSPKNMLIHQGRLFLLDHEVTHLGDPAFDLGFFLAHVLSKAHHFPDRRDAFLDAALRFWSAYQGYLAIGSARRSSYSRMFTRASRRTLATGIPVERGTRASKERGHDAHARAAGVDGGAHRSLPCPDRMTLPEQIGLDGEIAQTATKSMKSDGRQYYENLVL